MATIIFKGSVSAQVQAGETVTITVTKPDGTTDIFTATTMADKSWSVSKEYTVAGSYSAVAHVGEDAQYFAADTSSIPFEVPKLARTITMTVEVT